MFSALRRGTSTARTDQPDHTAPADPAGPPRWFTLAFAATVIGVNLAQQPGRVTFDTKLDLQADPAGFLSRALTLWNPDSAFGELQNQASGYLFPLGPAYLLGDLLGVPVWVWERLFSALLMLVAYDGMRRLARAWGGLGTWATVLAGVSYMLAPRLVSTVGALTGETLATSVLPWTAIPVALWLRGRLPAGRAVLYSVATVPLMGGQNATEVLAALSFVVVLIAVNGRTPRERAAFLAAWLAGLVVVSLWWLLPLLMLGRYGSPFLSYVESAPTTTDRIGWLSALRGTDHWVTFLAPGDSSSWQAGFALASEPALLVATATVAGIGLLGLAAPVLRHRSALVVALLVGLFALTAGSGAWAGSLLDGPWTTALDGWLAPFRNVHKFDPVVRTVLALGLGAAAQQLSLLAERVQRRRRVVGAALAVALSLPVAMSAAPAFAGELRDDSGFGSIPEHWTETAAFLRDQPGPVRALVVPGAGFAIQSWGRTIDEPLQVLDAPPWSTRSQTPLMPPGTIRMLDGIEAALTTGRPEPHFAALLARAGITHVVVRNDLDYRFVDAPRPELVHRVLDGSPGLLQVARFGDSGALYPPVEVYAVHGDQPDPRVRLFAADAATTVAGGSESLRQLVADGLVDPWRAMIRDTGRLDAEEEAVPVGVVTDTLRRIERNFGRVHFATSDVMTATAEFRNRRAAHDYVYLDDDARTTAAYAGISEVVASSSKGYADTFGSVAPEMGPFAALDGSLLTSWTTATFADPEGSWIELRFAEPTVLGRMSLRFDVTNGAGVREVRLDTDGETNEVPVDLNGDVQSIGVQTAPTRVARFTVVDAQDSIRPVMLNEISIDGIDVVRTLETTGVADSDSSLSFEGGVQRPACVGYYGGLSCGSDYQILTTDGVGWGRRVTMAEDGEFLVSGSVVSSGGEGIATLLGPIDDREVRAIASSWLSGDPATVPQNAVDGQPSTTWVAAPDDAEPVLDLRWRSPRRITRVLPTLAPDTPGTLPTALAIETDDGFQRIELGEVAPGFIDPVRTSRLRITLLRGELPEDTALGISELQVDGLEDLKYHAPADLPTGRTCGLGPRVSVDRTVVDTEVSGTVGDLISGAPLRLEACGDAAAGVAIGAGEQTIRVENVDGFAVRDLTFNPSLPEPAEPVKGGLDVTAWGPSSRTVAVDVPDEAAILAVTQSRNAGWTARLDDTELEPVEVDGWMQGWRLPAGSAGDVRLTFEPQVRYVVGLVVGLAAAGLTMLAALVLAWQRPVRASGEAPVDDARENSGWGRGPIAVLLVLLAVVSLPAAAGGLVGATLGRRHTQAIVVGAALALVAAIVLGVRGLAAELASPESANVLVATVVGAVVVLAVRGPRGQGQADG